MAITNTVKSDIIRDSVLVNDAGMITIKRVYVVYGMDPADKFILDSALKAPGIPAYGALHPIHTKAYAKTFTSNPIIDGKYAFNTAAEVTVTYVNRQPGLTPVSIEFSSAIRQYDCDTDNEGNMIYSNWKGAKEPNDPYTPSRLSGQLIPQRGVVPKTVIDDIITLSSWFLVTGPAYLSYPTGIEAFKNKYMGKVSDAPFRGKHKHVWMVADVYGKTEDFGKSYQFSIKLEARNGGGSTEFPDGWDEWVYFRQYNGEIPRDAKKDFANPENSNGVRKITNNYLEADFSQIVPDMIELSARGV